MIHALLAVALVAFPHLRINVPSAYSYVGSDSFVLYGISNCHQDIFTQADARGVFSHMYWIQTESYLPLYPKLHHTYTSKRHVRIGGVDFLIDTWIEHNDSPGAHADSTADLVAFMKTLGYGPPSGLNSGSDEQHVDQLLKAKGQRWPPTTASVRLVHLADATQRKELMVIYTRPVSGPLKTVEAQLIAEAVSGVTVTGR